MRRWPNIVPTFVERAVFAVIMLTYLKQMVTQWKYSASTTLFSINASATLRGSSSTNRPSVLRLSSYNRQTRRLSGYFYNELEDSPFL